MKSPLGTPGNPRTCNIDIMHRDNLRWSWAMGCQPNEIEDRVREHPDRVYDPDGRLLIRNRNHKLRELKRHGMIER